jgi:carboxyl-terminal processing protease
MAHLMGDRSTTTARVLTMLAALLAAGLVFGVHDGPIVARRTPQPTVHDVQRLVQKYYVREIDDQALTRAALGGMMDALDPYSGFMPPRDAKSFRDDTEGQFGGLGIEITIEDGLVLVIAPLEGTPAFEAGILPGDRVIEIDGVPHEFRTAEEAARVLKGKPGSTVQLLVVHEGASRPVEVQITRAVIRVRSVKRPQIVDADRGIGYVRISQFGPETGNELREAVRELEAEGMRGLVIDLRSNPGGHLEAALSTADLFLSDGVILKTEGRIERRTRTATAEGTNQTLSLAVLVNGFSASASEIVAGSLQDAGRAVVVGTRTFGKGSVQQLIPLGEVGNESLLRLTTALWYTRSGKRIHRLPGVGPDEPWGITPDVIVSLEPAQLQRIYRAQSANGFRDSGAEHPPLWRPDDPELADPQLEAAVEALREKLGS